MKKTFLSIVLFISLLSSCGGKNRNLKIVAEFKLKIPEPSGLALSADGKNLWMVSDQNSTVYFTSLNGTIIKSFKVNAEDLEGITILSDTSLAVISERSSEILFLNNGGKEYARKELNIDGKSNVGPEGLSYDRKNRRYFVVKEKKPKLLYEYDSKFNEVKKTKIDFVDDLSDINYISEKDELWVISDESKLVAKCSTRGEVKEKYTVDINQIEGIAVDYRNKKIYLVSDSKEKLYVVEMK